MHNSIYRYLRRLSQTHHAVKLEVWQSTRSLLFDFLQACRCIVSYETPQFEQFALCILQLHNCRGLSAEIPMRPDPAPMTQWRGTPLSHETAEDLFIGWISKGPQLPDGGEARLQPYSWLVAAGKNPVSGVCSVLGLEGAGCQR